MKTSLDHLPEEKQQEIATIAMVLRQTLTEYVETKQGSKREFQIWKIILFGSYAKGTWVSDPDNGYISDYDILVVVNNEDLVEDDVVWQRAKDAIDEKVTSAPLGLIVHSLKDINERLQQGHYFFKDIREEGIVLYSTSRRELAQPGKLTPEEQQAIARRFYSQWLASSDDDFAMYQYSRKDGRIKKAAFELHQTVEHLYSCVLLTCTNYLPKSHNIEKLAKLCAQIDPEFKSIFPLDTKFHRRSFRRLQRAYVEARYSEHFEITEEELDYLAGQVSRLKTQVKTVCLIYIGQ